LNRTEFITAALAEDIGRGDISTLSSIPAGVRGKAILKIKENGIMAGVSLAQDIFRYLEPGSNFTTFKRDGERMIKGETAFEVNASVHTILQAERLTLNCMQRMSGIATLTHQFVDKVRG
jgi:nicotinate-nucleotide pyrophosphorylase (carboxylating)